MKKFNKKRNITFLLVLFLSIGFATLTANLYVNGFALFKGGKFDIHFENVKVNEEGVTPENVEITADDTVEFEASLESPGEFVEFNVDVVNSGKIDGMIDSLEKKIYNGEEEIECPEYAEYSVTYADGKAIEQYHSLASGAKVTYKIRVTYKEEADTSSIEDTGTAISFKLKANFVKADSNAKDIYE